MDDLSATQNYLYSKLKNAFSNFKKLGQAKMTLGQAEARLAQLKDCFEEFKAGHQNILDSDEVDFKHKYFTDKVFEIGEDYYYSNLGDFNDFTASLKEKSLPHQTTQAVGLTSATNYSDFSSLLNIQLPKFSGKYEEWENFRDVYRALVHRNDDIPPILKFNGLRTHVTGEAVSLIKNIAISEENYSQAWSALTGYYDNQRRLVTTYVNAILDTAPMKSSTRDELKRLSSETLDPLASLLTLDRQIEDADVIIGLIASKFEFYTSKEWQRYLGKANTPPTLHQLKDFLSAQIITLESCPQRSFNNRNQITPVGKANQQNTTRNQKSISSHQTTTVLNPKDNPTCPCCKKGHRLHECEYFKAKAWKDKHEFVLKNQLCINCFGRHLMRDCQSKRKCFQCKRDHHTLLHREVNEKSLRQPTSSFKIQSLNSSPGSSSMSPDQSSPTEVANTTLLHTTHVTKIAPKLSILLATARVFVCAPDGTRFLVRALVDQCSQTSLVSRSLCELLKLRQKRVNTPLTGVGDGLVAVAKGLVNLTIRPYFDSTFNHEFEALVVPKVSSYKPLSCDLVEDLPYLKDLQLADPEYASIDSIDLSLDAAVHAVIIEAEIRKGNPGQLIASRSSLGWLLSGPYATSSHETEPSNLVMHCKEDLHLSELLQKFWQVEEPPNRQSQLTADELACEHHFLDTFSRDKSGRFVVRLPFKNSPHILDTSNLSSDTYRSALAMLRIVEAKFSRNPTLFEKYNQFMNEYIQFGHMVHVEPETLTYCYLPHHGVFKESSTTTKLRVVFNASAKTKSGLSLNDHLFTGANLVPNLFDLVSHWRNYQFVFTADVEKMFRQIKVSSADQAYQAILWRSDPTQPIRTYHLATVTYGLASSPFQATRVLRQLASEHAEALPLGAQILHTEFYVDDALSGGHTVEETLNKRDQLINITHLGGFPLRKWSANCPELLNSLPNEILASHPLSLMEQESISVLGLVWNPIKDEFTFKLDINCTNTSWTKRSLLSQLARFYDPLGWLSPTIIFAKILLQSLWLLKISWDDELPASINLTWNQWLGEAEQLNRIKIPRWNYFSPIYEQFEVHGYADASKNAYAAVVYTRIIINNQAFVSLQLARTKVAPMKTLSIPRLELCAAQLVSKLVSHFLLTAVQSTPEVHLWSDSRNVLHWLRAAPSRWPTFIANRCSQIQSLCPTAQWHYVTSKTNPADIASRGVFPGIMAEQTLWFNGPTILHENHPTYPVFNNVDPPVIPLLTKITPELFQTSFADDLYRRYSSWNRLLRVTAHCLRFVYKCYLKIALKNKESLQFQACLVQQNNKPEVKANFPFIDLESFSRHVTIGVTPEEIENARLFWVYQHQQRHFKDEFIILEKNSALPLERRLALPLSSPIVRLNPVLDRWITG